jgi:catechol 2,3-dioxygenase-like lactoylglutathione lyase family enzyme
LAIFGFLKLASEDLGIANVSVLGRLIFKEEDRRTGTFQGRSAYFHDPDRNVIEIIDLEKGPVYETQDA